MLMYDISAIQAEKMVTDYSATKEQQKSKKADWALSERIYIVSAQ